MGWGWGFSIPFILLAPELTGCTRKLRPPCYEMIRSGRGLFPWLWFPLKCPFSLYANASSHTAVSLISCSWLSDATKSHTIGEYSAKKLPTGNDTFWSKCRISGNETTAPCWVPCKVAHKCAHSRVGRAGRWGWATEEDVTAKALEGGGRDELSSQNARQALRKTQTAFALGRWFIFYGFDIKVSYEAKDAVSCSHILLKKYI